MTGRRVTSPNRGITAGAIALAVVVFGAGCSTTREGVPPIEPKVQSSSLSSVPATPNLDVGLTKPPVSLGDVFVYNNPPMQWTVTSIDGPYIGWTSDTGGMLQTAWSTLLPPLRWGGGDSAMDVGQRKITQLQGKFFPLKKGNRVTFIEETVYARPGAAVNAYWQCDVGDQSEIVVPAGKAQVWEILCLQNGHEKKVMYYSEKLGQVVRTAMTSENGLIIRQLTGFARGRASMPVLENNPSSTPAEKTK
jgi:hypothetical protein